MALEFRLRKWYLDAVSVDGEVFVGYQARLEFRHLSVQHASFLLSPRRGSERSASTWTRAPTPECGSSGVRWSVPRLGVRGTWTAGGVAISRRLFGSDDGVVDWKCLLPAARVCLDFSDGRRLEGQGYAEVLEMTIPPWRLPIRELRWGRFLADDGQASVVWIDWKGPRALSFAALNGAPCEAAEIGETGVVLGDPHATVELTDPRVLRDGPLARTVLSRIPVLRRRLPLRILETYETKWLSRGVLEREGIRRAGWAVHEVVRWP
ncbi:MAG: hypothetical protein ACHQM4_06980 [Thermoanaerobaculia bacterium]